MASLSLLAITAGGPCSEGLSGVLAALGMLSFSLSLMEAQIVLFHTELPSSFLEPGTAAGRAGAGEQLLCAAL